jgi:hypothetical protein
VPGLDRCGLALLALLAAGLPDSCRATLGEGVASIQADTLRVAAVRRVQGAVAVQVHTLTLPDGSTIRQYVSPAGIVFAVGWNTHYKPRLDQLLGVHFGAYSEGGRRLMAKRPGVRHSVSINEGDLVVESMAHLNAFVGRAYLRSRVPATVAVDALR